MDGELHMRPMTRSEVDILVEWAAQEGWNPGLHDAEIFWNTDPDAFWAAQLGDEMIGGGAIVSYDGSFGFMGFFIVKPEFRGRGLGNELWHFRKNKLTSRLRDPVRIGMDGVFDMQDYYAKGGFAFLNRDLRFEGIGESADVHDNIVAVSGIPFGQLMRYDAEHFPVPRPHFLRQWIDQPDSCALAYVEDDEIGGYGVARRCRRGFKFGPLFANTPNIAERLFLGLGNHARGEPIFLDTPEINPCAPSLARRHGMEEVFGCARMYLGPPPTLPHEQIFGVTSFELG